MLDNDLPWYGGSPLTIPANTLPSITEEQTQQIIALFEEKVRVNVAVKS